MNELAEALRTEHRTLAIESTYKARDVEGALDLLFYRPVGFQVARLFARTSISPDQVTLLATFCGVIAGHLYYYEALSVNVAGMLLHVCANLFDNVDGQLARLTDRKSEQGRVIDGIGDNIVFLSVYVHLCLRVGSPIVWPLALAAGVCHSWQSAGAEFIRDAYVHFATTRVTHLFSSGELRADARRSRGWRKLLFVLHANYVAQQELALGALARLRDQVQRVTSTFRESYRDAHRALVRHARLLGTSTRMLVLFVVLLLRRPSWYFIAELTVFNAIFVWLITRQNALAARFARVES